MPTKEPESFTMEFVKKSDSIAVEKKRKKQRIVLTGVDYDEYRLDLPDVVTFFLERGYDVATKIKGDTLTITIK